jgi:hypothetical protein
MQVRATQNRSLESPTDVTGLEHAMYQAPTPTSSQSMMAPDVLGRSQVSAYEASHVLMTLELLKRNSPTLVVGLLITTLVLVRKFSNNERVPSVCASESRENGSGHAAHRG